MDASQAMPEETLVRASGSPHGSKVLTAKSSRDAGHHQTPLRPGLPRRSNLKRQIHLQSAYNKAADPVDNTNHQGKFFTKKLQRIDHAWKRGD